MRPGRARRTEVYLGDALSGSVFREGIARHIVSYSPRRHVPGGRREPDVGRKAPQGVAGPRSRKIKEELEAGGCSIPFPQRDVHIQQNGGAA
jgi:hypothetical protein